VSTFWRHYQIVVCAGTGGVGKTTVAAAIALAAARAGKRTLAMTIDPSRRLAYALGQHTIDNLEHPVAPEALREAGVELQAPLHVLVPDVRRTFDELIERSPLAAARKAQLLNNRIYQHFSSALAGSQEYAAIEKLYQVHQSGHYDLIVLDTPPSQNAVDFLEAPGRVLDFLENETLQWLVKPASATRFPRRTLGVGTAFFWRTLGSMTGGETLRELADFILSFREMYDGFRTRAAQVRSLLRSPQLAFTLVTSPAENQRHAMLHFYDELCAQGIIPRAVMVNRVHPMPPWGVSTTDAITAATRLLEPLDPEVTFQIIEAIKEEWLIAHHDSQALKELEARVHPTELVALPEQRQDVHDLVGLAPLQALFCADRGPTKS